MVEGHREWNLGLALTRTLGCRKASPVNCNFQFFKLLKPLARERKIKNITSPFGLDFGNLDFGTSDSGLTMIREKVINNHAHIAFPPWISVKYMEF